MSRFPSWVPEAVFAGLCVLAFGVLLTIGVEQWFFLDEWDFLSGRTAWDAHDLLRPHNEHWSTIPILLYRGLFRMFGLNSYVPYRGVTVLTHLACAVLMRALLRRVGVGAWLSIAVVLPWIFFGSGWQNIVWGFQVAWNGALALTLAQLLLADHPGPRRGRDALALLAGAGALMCAGIAVPLVAAVAVCLWLRRGWRVAALQAVPLAVVQLLWNARYGNNVLASRPTVENLRFVWRGLEGSVEAYAWTWLAAILLVVAVALGTALRWQATPRRERRDHFAIPAGLTLGAAGYLLFVSFGRVSFGLDTAVSSRYLHIIAFLLLPLIGTAIAELLRRTEAMSTAGRVVSVIGVVALLWAGLPGNLSYFSEETLARHLHVGNPMLVRATAAVLAGDPDLPRNGRPSELTPETTIGWYQDAVAQGYLEPLDLAREPILESLVRRSLQLVQVDEDFEPSSTCTSLDEPVELDLVPGDRVTFKALTTPFAGTDPADLEAFGVDVEISSDAYPTFDRRFITDHGDTLEALSPVHVVITNKFSQVEAELCR